jgi:uncharacterized Zn finger protein (UPF0148 family)
MLDKQCSICATVLLQTPMAQGGTQYCVNCIDIESAVVNTQKNEPKQIANKVYFRRK